MVRFTLFGIPVEIQGWFWITVAFLGGALDIDPSRIETIQFVLFFMLAATVSILVHEFGHALVGRHLAGSRPRIVLWSMGGLAYNEGGTFTRARLFWMTAAGPAAGFLLGLLVVAGICWALGAQEGINVSSKLLFNTFIWRPSEAEIEFLVNRPSRLFLLSNLLRINFWWGILNLLPILPLDGGRITELFVRPQRFVYAIGAMVAVVIALVGVLTRSFFMAAMFGFFAYQNYQQLSSFRR
jgi:stage IV sporulation protein FB